MRSSYKKIGPYIREVVEKNTELSVELLLGVSVEKEFIPSIANIIGTDMSTYKIVRKNQFAYGPVTSRNSDKVSIALLSEEECIVSTSYTVFEITDKNVLLPEYLMMWFRRPEFDRYARFKSHGSVRELFDWEEMCDVELPIPSIAKQREIVREYQTIVDRIRLNERLNKKLEETAQAIYKQWFVDFEFPISADYAAAIGKPKLEGQPYKSIGGEMVYDEGMKQEVPKGWTRRSFDEFFTVKTGKKDANFASPIGVYPFFTCAQTQTLFTDTYSFDCAAILLAGNGDFNLKVYEGKFEAYQRTYVLAPHEPKLLSVLYLALCHELPSIIISQRGSVISYLTKGMIGDHQVTFPTNDELCRLSMGIAGIVSQFDMVATEQRVLSSLQEVLLARLSIQGGRS